MAAAFILFITGTSASGKTTLYESLRADVDLSSIEFHDIDENGVPQVGRGPWRRFRIEQLLYEAVKRAWAGESTVICGLTKPSEVIESSYYTLAIPTHFLLIETSMPLVRERLLGRAQAIKTSGKFDESFAPSAVQTAIKANRELRMTLNQAVRSLKNGSWIDASKLTPLQMHDRAKAVIGNVLSGKKA